MSKLLRKEVCFLVNSLQNAQGQWDWTEGTRQRRDSQGLGGERVEEMERGLLRRCQGNLALKARSWR